MRDTNRYCLLLAELGCLEIIKLPYDVTDAKEKGAYVKDDVMTINFAPGRGAYAIYK